MLQLIGQIQMPVIALSGAAPRYFTMLASAERLMELEKYPEEKRKKEETSAFYGGLKAIVFDGVYFSYGREPVLENVNLKIKKGQFAVIKGEFGHRQEHAFETCAPRVSARKGPKCISKRRRDGGLRPPPGCLPTCRRETCFFRARCAKTCSF